jgi:hypothetical protein
MYNIYNIYLKLLGYIPWIEYERNLERKNIILQIFHYGYASLIFTGIVFPFIFQLIYYINNWDINFVISSFMTLLVPIQYILTLIYFRKNHFNKLVLSYGYNKRFIFILNVLTIFSFVISLIYTIICIVLGVKLDLSCITRFDQEIFNNFSKGTYISLIIINKILSSNIFFSVNIFFTNTLLLHARNIKNINNKIKEDINQNNINVLEICTEFLEERTSYSKTIKNLNNIFSITLLTSGSYIYIVIYDIFINKINTNNYVDYLRVIFYGIMIIGFAYSQNQINKRLNDINDSIYSVPFLKKNLIRLTINYNNNDENVDTYSYILDRENSNYLDWLAIVQMMQMKWETISFLGFELNGWDMIKQIITIGSSFIILIQALK